MRKFVTPVAIGAGLLTPGGYTMPDIEAESLRARPAREGELPVTFTTASSVAPIVARKKGSIRSFSSIRAVGCPPAAGGRAPA